MQGEHLNSIGSVWQLQAQVAQRAATHKEEAAQRQRELHEAAQREADYQAQLVSALASASPQPYHGRRRIEWD